MLLTFLAVTFAMTIMDIFYVLWMRRSAQGKAAQAALSAGAIMVCTGYVTVSYVGDPRLILAAVLGAVLGTFIAVKLDHKCQ